MLGGAPAHAAVRAVDCADERIGASPVCRVLFVSEFPERIEESGPARDPIRPSLTRALLWKLTWLGRAEAVSSRGLVPDGCVEVQLRVPVPGTEHPNYSVALFDSLRRELGSVGECEQFSLSNGFLRYHVVGKEYARLIDACRRSGAAFPLPDGTYIWRPEPSSPSMGYRSPVR